MKSICYFLFIVLVSFSSQAIAQESVMRKKTGITINIPPQVSELDKGYQKIKSTLSAEQVSQLEALDNEYMKTSAPDLEILHTGAKIEECQKLGLLPAAYSQQFILFRDKKNKYQESLWGDFFKTKASKIDFVDQKTLTMHFKSQTMTHLYMAHGLLQGVLRSKPMNVERCKEVDAEVKAYLATGH